MTGSVSPRGRKIPASEEVGYKFLQSLKLCPVKIPFLVGGLHSFHRFRMGE